MIGTDLIEVARIERAISRFGTRFTTRLFTDAEIAYCESSTHFAQRFAARFAAKEAVFKALGVPFTGWTLKDIEVTHHTSGAPCVVLSPRLASLAPKKSIHLSMSHTKDYATATALLL